MGSNTRRRLLQGLGAGTIALAGCFGGDGDDPQNGTGAENGDEGETGEQDEGTEDDPTGEEDESEELEIPAPVDWTDESRATIEVGQGGEDAFVPDAVRVETGTTLRWVWMTDGHSVVPTHQPSDAGFEGSESVEDGGFEFEFVPETPGEYRYVREEHEEMVGYLVVEE
ncbi:plastocyanin/azurin family copper-binding protein [Natronoarchaeum sp. GCM10025703]|uniref:cupredoxin domain-containing protein n=1 Tax=unclassified Natronoarchaeum TaxID=2620183 RepID=UPI00360BCBA6